MTYWIDHRVARFAAVMNFCGRTSGITWDTERRQHRTDDPTLARRARSLGARVEEVAA